MIKSDAFLMSANQIRSTSAELNAKTAISVSLSAKSDRKDEEKTITLNHITFIYIYQMRYSVLFSLVGYDFLF